MTPCPLGSHPSICHCVHCLTRGERDLALHLEYSPAGRELLDDVLVDRPVDRELAGLAQRLEVPPAAAEAVVNLVMEVAS